MHRASLYLLRPLMFTAVWAVLLGAPSAHATQTDTCEFDGLAHVSPIIPPIGLRPDTTGTYTLTGTSPACVVTDSAGNTVATGTADITSGGSFSSIACGTGNLSGSADIEFSTGQAYLVDYTIFATAGHGVLQLVHGPTGSGVVSIIPADPPPPVGNGFGGNCVTSSVSYFRIRGAFSIAVP